MIKISLIIIDKRLFSIGENIMFNDEYLSFIPYTKNTSYIDENDIWFIFTNGKLLVKINHSQVELPNTKDIENINYLDEKVYNIGLYNGHNCLLFELKHDVKLGENFEYHELRNLLSSFDRERFELCSRALHLLTWYKNNIYCSRCGALFVDKEGERSKLCPECGFIVYPRISPAIIVAVVKDDKILLASNKRFAMKLYSVLAGFVEPGETFEDCVKREVYEEVKIKVKNIKYFGSQPWPFPDSLMVGFTAEYAGGEIEVDGEEIIHAEWFSVDNLPETPRKGSISSELIDWFKARYLE
jgi:NAD+ diphosphatase